ncbi:hypothetical protein RclHR1_08330006 [Rhizophagus clarus]|uniref:F-box domain-containing protein n=1 Tax=Rhizophagus clarus TaxID=94130 RepID=A0A2Z6S709_9GLOM|nr:hypothetical protein RclHR1_08330006 [Rhizophagus clarus]
MSCSKIFTGDLPELTYEIIKYIHDDFSTLHSCILVNRLWCRLAIPLLWENPFSIPTKNYNFIEIYLHNLNDDNDDLKTNLIGYTFAHNSLLFNYPKFLKHLNTWKVITSIGRWFIGSLKPENRNLELIQNFKRLVYTSLFKIFIENEVNLHTFEIEIINRDYSYFNDILELILQNKNFIYNTKNLNLYFGNPTGSAYIYDTNEYTLIKNRMLQVINLHQNLKKISFYDNYYHLHQSFLLSPEDYNCSNTLKSISLFHIRLNYMSNLNKIFEYLNVLESVHIIYCYLDITFVQKIINLSKPLKLKSLFISRFQGVVPLKLLLQKCGDYLENFGFVKRILQQRILELITKYCKNIKFLNLRGSNIHIYNQILDLIVNVKQNLNYLSLSGYNNIRLNSIILRNLGQALPSKLEYLSLCFCIQKSDFEVFLKDSQDTFIRKLLINNENGQEILPSVKEYIMKKKRVEHIAIKSIAFSEEINDLFEFDDEMKEFKLYNVSVRSYFDLSIEIDDFIMNSY